MKKDKKTLLNGQKKVKMKFNRKMRYMTFFTGILGQFFYYLL